MTAAVGTMEITDHDWKLDTHELTRRGAFDEIVKRARVLAEAQADPNPPRVLLKDGFELATAIETSLVHGFRNIDQLNANAASCARARPARTSRSSRSSDHDEALAIR